MAAPYCSSSNHMTWCGELMSSHLISRELMSSHIVILIASRIVGIWLMLSSRFTFYIHVCSLVVFLSLWPCPRNLHKLQCRECTLSLASSPAEGIA